MSIDYAVFIEGLSDLDVALRETNPAIIKAATRAINDTAARTRTASADEIRQQVNFPVSYLKPSGKRLTVTKKAGVNSLEAIITGRRRATSLARFAKNAKPGKMGVTLQVKRGRSTTLDRAFLMPLKSGSNVDSMGNVGLAIRTDKVRPSKAYKPVRITDSLWLLYGPSVDQVFKSVRGDVSGEAAAHLEREFLRLLKVDL